MTVAIQCPTNRPTLQFGAKGESVRAMQRALNQRLAELDILSHPPLQVIVDGDYGPLTRDAVKYFQCIAYLTVDGVVGPKTWAYLCDGSVTMPVLRQGSSGSLVRAVQQALKDGGFYSGAVDGAFGPRTNTAVRDFQEFRGLVVDGVIGSQTWEALSQFDVHISQCSIAIFGDN